MLMYTEGHKTVRTIRSICTFKLENGLTNINKISYQRFRSTLRVVGKISFLYRHTGNSTRREHVSWSVLCYLQTIHVILTKRDTIIFMQPSGLCNVVLRVRCSTFSSASASASQRKAVWFTHHVTHAGYYTSEDTPNKQSSIKTKILWYMMQRFLYNAPIF